MKHQGLIEAAKQGLLSRVDELIEAGADVHEQDEQGWTPLNWAAGKGDVALIGRLLAAGADVFQVGRDQRTPYQIALAAGRLEAAKQLRDAESKTRPDHRRETRPYCKAYLLGKFRQFQGFDQELRSKEIEGEGINDDEILFLHQDFTLTRSMWPNESVVYDKVTPEWREYCTRELRFSAPDDLDLVVTAASAGDAVKRPQ